MSLDLRHDGPTLVGRVPILTGMRNVRGMPQVAFIEEISAFVQDHNVPLDEILQALSTIHSKYRFMESQTRDNRSRIVAKIPDITASLEAVEMLIAKRDAAQPVQTFFQLADNVFTQATVPPCDRVCLWLGANIMLEYSSDEACALLKSQLAAAETKQAHFTEDLGFLRDQIITVEVNMARLFNHDVKTRRQAGLPAGGGAAIEAA